MSGRMQQLAFLLLGLILFSGKSSQAGALHDFTASDAAVNNMLNRFDEKIYFTRNQGQYRQGVLFKADFPLGQAIATPQGMLIKAYDPASVEARREDGERIEQEIHDGLPARALNVNLRGHGWMMRFLNSSASMKVEGRDAHGDPMNFFMGNKSAVGVQSFQEVWYRNVYRNVDVRYYPAEDGTMEYDIICKPGFDASRIAVSFDGLKELQVIDGRLVLATSVGDIAVPAPVAYQQINGQREFVSAAYTVQTNILRFQLGKYDPAYPVIIDPIALRWATWVNTNSSSDNHGHCIWVDPTDGAIYMVARVVGTTDEITVGAFDETANGNLDMIVGKYLEPSAVGQSGTRVWQTYLGGSGDDNPYAMEQGPDGNLYITGYTSSSNYPLIGGGAFTGSSVDQRGQTVNNIFVTKITPDGASIKSAVIGGNQDEGSFDIRLDATGNPVVCGNTRSTNLATLYSGSGASNSNAGNADILIFKLNQDLSSVQWMKNYGGSSADVATIMLLNNANGDLFLGGYTNSTNFPVSNARQSTLAGSQSGILQKLDGNGNVAWSSYFQSASNRSTSILCMEFSLLKDQLYFGGITTGLAASNISSFGVLDNTQNGSNDFFVCRMDTNQNFVASTYLGGTGSEGNMMGLNTDQNNDVYIFGYSGSSDFPVSGLPNTPLQTTNLGSNDKTFTKINSDLSSLVFSTYYGGSNDDYDPVGERGIKFSNCRIYTIVTSGSNNIPLTTGALNTTKNSNVGLYEPGLVVWANPPDLLGNSITGTQGICAGNTPGDLSGSEPAYVLPEISRNGTGSSYPSLGSAATYQWQISTDSVTWNDIPGATSQNLLGSQIGPLFEKTFFRRIIGGDACILAGVADQVVTVNIATAAGTVTNLRCFQDASGSITATSNGVAPFDYLWSDGQTTETATSLSAGNYSVTVTDLNGCSATASFTLTEPDLLTVSATGSTVTCTSGPGEATASALGGTPGYNFYWNSSPAQTSATATNLLPGVYTVVVTDANQCSATSSATVNESDPIVATLNSTPATCNAADGVLEVIVTSGTAPFTYAWNPSVSTGSVASGLTPGFYEVSVSDANGCSTVLNAFINATGVNAFAVSQTDATCSNGDNGSATVGGSGGIAPYSYLWMPIGDTTATVNNLAPGTYTVMVSDYTGCPAYVQVAIGYQNRAQLVELGNDVVECLGMNVTLDAGAGFQSYLWNTNETSQAINVGTAGNYSVLATDVNGCESLDALNVDFIQCQVTRAAIAMTNDRVTVFPNPAHDRLEIRSKNLAAGNVTIRLSDALGKTVQFSEETGGESYSKTLDLHQLKPGVYFLHIRNGGNDEYVKVVVE